MIRFLVELWPATLPLLLYALWMFTRRIRALKCGGEVPAWLSGPWLKAVLASAGIMVLLMLLYGASMEPVKGEYIPPHMKNGVLVPGTVEQ